MRGRRGYELCAVSCELAYLPEYEISDPGSPSRPSLVAPHVSLDHPPPASASVPG